MTYQEFLRRKERPVFNMGFMPNYLNPILKPFQKFCVTVALSKGRFGLFQGCGTGKTFEQEEWALRVSEFTGKPSLILAPLAVVGQSIEEGEKFGIKVDRYGSGNIQISNYEQLENLDLSIFGGIVLDESSILKNFEGAYRNRIIELTRHIPFRLSCSATPSPNDPMELGSQCEFLGIMTRNEMLATYFTHDGGETSKWRLKKHAVTDFWKWVNSWCLMFEKPSDIGFSDEGYVLPGLNFIERKVITPIKDGRLYNETSISSTDMHAEIRLTKMQRLAEVVEIVNNSTESFIVWVEHSEEGDYLKKNLTGAIEVKGSDKPEYKSSKLLGFAKDEFRVLVTKPKIASFGLNYQNCHNMVFASPDHSFEKIFQAIARELRFGQSQVVNVYAMITDTMQSAISSYNRKRKQHKEMIKQLSKHTKEIYKEYYEQHRIAA